VSAVLIVLSAEHVKHVLAVGKIVSCSMFDDIFLDVSCSMFEGVCCTAGNFRGRIYTLHLKGYTLKRIDFGGESFRGFAVIQFATQTNVASECDLVENEISTRGKLVTELHGGVRGYQPVFLSVSTLWE